MAMMVYTAFQIAMEGHHCIQLSYVLVIHYCVSREATVGISYSYNCMIVV